MPVFTRKLVVAAVVGVIGLSTAANADRGGYSRARSDASARYERGGSRGDYSRGDYSRGYSRGYDHSDYRGRDYGGGSRSSFGLSLGYSSFNDSSYWGFGFSSGRGYGRSGGYYGGSYRYIEPRPVYVEPPLIYAAPPVYYEPPVYYGRTYYAPSYYGPSYGGYYCR